MALFRGKIDIQCSSTWWGWDGTRGSTCGLEVVNAMAKKENIDISFALDLLHGASWEKYECLL